MYPCDCPTAFNLAISPKYLKIDEVSNQTQLGWTYGYPIFFLDKDINDLNKASFDCMIGENTSLNAI